MQTLELKLSHGCEGTYVMEDVQSNRVVFETDKDLLPQPDKRIKIRYPSNVPLDEVKAHTIRALYHPTFGSKLRLLAIPPGWVAMKISTNFYEGNVGYHLLGTLAFGVLGVPLLAYSINLRGLVRNWKTKRKLENLKHSNELVLNDYKVGVEWIPDESLIEHLEPEVPPQTQDAQSELEALRAKVAGLEAQLGQEK